MRLCPHKKYIAIYGKILSKYNNSIYNIQSISLSVLSPKRKRIRQVPEDRAEMSYRVIGQWDCLERKKGYSLGTKIKHLVGIFIFINKESSKYYHICIQSRNGHKKQSHGTISRNFGC